MQDGFVTKKKGSNRATSTATGRQNVILERDPREPWRRLTGVSPKGGGAAVARQPGARRVPPRLMRRPGLLIAFTLVALLARCSSGVGGTGGGATGGAGGGMAGGAGGAAADGGAGVGGGAGAGTGAAGGSGGGGGGTGSGGGGASGCEWLRADAGANGSCAAKPGAPSAIGLAEAAPVALPLGVVKYKNLTIGSRGGYVLQGDLAVPPLDAGVPGILIVVHGGGWADCDRRRTTPDAETFAFLTSALLKVATFNVEYRLVEEGAAYPENLSDIKCAIQVAAAQLAPRFGLDGTRIAIAGESAGAHLALMVGLTQGRAELDPHCSANPPRVSLVLSYSAPGNLPGFLLPQADGGPQLVSGAVSSNAGPCTSQVSRCAQGRACDRCIDASPIAHGCEGQGTTFAVIEAPDGYDQLIPTSEAFVIDSALRDGGADVRLMVPSVAAVTDAGCDLTFNGQAHGWNRQCLLVSTGPSVAPLVQAAIGPR